MYNKNMKKQVCLLQNTQKLKGQKFEFSVLPENIKVMPNADSVSSCGHRIGSSYRCQNLNRLNSIERVEAINWHCGDDLLVISRDRDYLGPQVASVRLLCVRSGENEHGRVRFLSYDKILLDSIP